MSQISTYATLLSEIDSWDERSYTTGEKEGFIQVFETEANILLGADYRRTTTATVNTDANGEGTLPTGFVSMRSVVRDVVGSAPLIQTSWHALIGMNPNRVSDDATHFAVRGTTLKVVPITDDNFLCTYDSTLTGITSSNTTNWLLTACPNAYLYGCLGAAAAFNKSFGEAATWRSLAAGIVEAFVGQGNVGQYGNAEIFIDSPTP